MHRHSECRRWRLRALLAVIIALAACSLEGSPTIESDASGTVATRSDVPSTIGGTSSSSSTSTWASTSSTQLKDDGLTGPSQTPVDAARDGVLPEIAALPFSLRVNPVSGFGGEPVSVTSGKQVWVVSKPDTEQYEGNLLVGDPAGAYGRDFVYLSTYGEILLLNSERNAVLRAFPMAPAAPPLALVATDDAVYCHRAGDGGEPDGTLCRVDRESFDLIMRIFPSSQNSSFEEVSWIPDGWTIDETAGLDLAGRLMVGDVVEIVSSDRVLRFDPDSLRPLDGS